MTTQSPWKKLSSKYAYMNPWIKIREDEVVQPNGQNSTYGIIEGKKFVMAIPRNDDGSFIMIEQYRYPVNRYSLEFPAGGIIKGETVEQALKRELQEEAQVNAGKIKQLAYLDVANNFTSIGFYVYLAEDLSKAEQIEHDPSEGEIKTYNLTLSEIKKRIQDGIITDSQTIAALGIYLQNI